MTAPLVMLVGQGDTFWITAESPRFKLNWIECKIQNENPLSPQCKSLIHSHWIHWQKVMWWHLQVLMLTFPALYLQTANLLLPFVMRWWLSALQRKMTSTYSIWNLLVINKNPPPMSMKKDQHHFQMMMGCKILTFCLTVSWTC